MARIAGVTLPPNKRVDIGLTYIFGIGRTLAHDIIAQTQIGPATKVKALSEKETVALRELIENNYRVEGELKREILLNIKRLKEIGSYRGVRHMKGLPVRGQRTKTNSRTRRGNIRKTMGSGRRPAAEKT